MIKKPRSIIRSKSLIILASNSQPRIKMLKDTGLIFTQIKSEVNEKVVKKKFKGKNYCYLAKNLAEAKALNISKKKREAYVIGADQICVNQGKIYSKPKFKKKALEQLIELNGKTHKLISAISICYNSKIIWNYSEEVKLKMRKLSEKVLRDYVDLDLPLESCGSYKFESNGKYLFSKVVGDTSTILGLPLYPLLNTLYEKNVIAYV